MFTNYIKFIVIITLLYQNPLYSKSKSFNEINSNYLSNYFSGIIAYENKDNSNALKFFKSSKALINSHDPYFKRYVYSMILEGNFNHVVGEIKKNLGSSNSDFFETYLIMALNSLKMKDFKKSRDYLKKSSNYIYNDKFALIIYESLKEYLYVFEENKLPKQKKKLGNLSIINEAFQRCYLQDKNTQVYFSKLINISDESDFSRYLFFNINHLVSNKKFKQAVEITNKLNYLDTTLLISQSKKWIEEEKFDNFKKIFSCQNHNDIIAEFLFLIANLYTSQNDYENSNFYLNISNYLNPKFKFNLTLLIENYYTEGNYVKAKKKLRYFNERDDHYYWFKVKKNSQMIFHESNENEALNFINKKFKKIKKPSSKIIFDMANFSKNAKRYQDAIDYYDDVISKIEINSSIYAEILYRRGSCYERMKKFLRSDEDFLKALEIAPDDAYVLNYLAYSWLERGNKIEVAMKMLKKAYNQKSNDPYIIDSIGWAYYLVDDFLKAESFIKRAVELMPNDPIVNDHYGDILWKLDRKIQARYFWRNVLNLKETDDDMKKNVNAKLIDGLKTSL